jgi:alcohol dehydrogenase
VLMGSMQVDLPITYQEMLLNNWELIGHFMYTRADYLALVSMVASGQIPLEAVELKSYPFAELETAIDAAGRMSGLQCTVVEGKSREAWG